MPVRAPSFERVTFTLTDMGRLPSIHDWQFRIIDGLIEKAGAVTISAQGGEFVLQEYLSLRDGVSFYEREDFDLRLAGSEMTQAPRGNWTGGLAPGGLVRSVLKRRDLHDAEKSVRWYYRDAPERVRDALVTNGFFSPLLSEYIRHSRGQSLYCGTRLHGNLIALMQGTPAVFAIHDYRLKDMAEYLELPRVSIEDNKTDFDLSQQDWSAYSAKLHTIWDGFVDFFAENGLASTLERRA